MTPFCWVLTSLVEGKGKDGGDLGEEEDDDEDNGDKKPTAIDD